MNAYTHELKTWPMFFEDILLYRKNFELRKDDRGFQVGDILWLREWDRHNKKYTGRDVKRVVTYILKDFDGIKEGYIIMEIKSI